MNDMDKQVDSHRLIALRPSLSKSEDSPTDFAQSEEERGSDFDSDKVGRHLHDGHDSVVDDAHISISTRVRGQRMRPNVNREKRASALTYIGSRGCQGLPSFPRHRRWPNY